MEHGTILKKYMEQNSPPNVYLQIDLSLDHPDNRVEYELWYGSILDLTPTAISQIGEYQKPFTRDALFTPRILTFSCESCPEMIKSKDCVSDGRYCAYLPVEHVDDRHYEHAFFHEYQEGKNVMSEELIGSTTGRDLLIEGLIERCLF